MESSWWAMVAALLVAGCATGTPSPPPPSPSATGETRPIAWYQRCSPIDPNRTAWYCVIGQIGYSLLGGMQPPDGPGIK